MRMAGRIVLHAMLRSARSGTIRQLALATTPHCMPLRVQQHKVACAACTSAMSKSRRSRTVLIAVSTSVCKRYQPKTTPFIHVAHRLWSAHFNPNAVCFMLRHCVQLKHITNLHHPLRLVCIKTLRGCCELRYFDVWPCLRCWPPCVVCRSGSSPVVLRLTGCAQLWRGLIYIVEHAGTHAR